MSGRLPASVVIGSDTLASDKSIWAALAQHSQGLSNIYIFHDNYSQSVGLPNQGHFERANINKNYYRNKIYLTIYDVCALIKRILHM